MLVMLLILSLMRDRTLPDSLGPDVGDGGSSKDHPWAHSQAATSLAPVIPGQSEPWGEQKTWLPPLPNPKPELPEKVGYGGKGQV